ncbi:glycosyltransferase [Paenibacillus xylaniclasticus]|uniref:glycosyltransferase n=1 Tax=Paenibacillus xylaniclasticus TaxID=588083 RepID=UPI000FD8B25D|nr:MULTISPECIES: glycosyltransferase [Paenibacillus]GFN29854.1 arabinose kinase [Paenibacillus curdlanolyticus]
MHTVAYYVSDYGYGHAARSIAVIRAWLQSAATPYRIVVCSSERILSFMRSSLQEHSESVCYRRCASELGYVLHAGSIEPDFAAFRKKYKAYVQALPMEVRREADFLHNSQVELVVSDISPIALLAAQQAQIRSAGVSNFTWYTAYRSMLDRLSLQPLNEAYAAMDYYIRLAGAKEPDWGRLGSMESGFYCRKPDWNEVSAIRETINPGGKKMLVYFAIGMSIDVHQLGQMKLWENEAYHFIVSSNMKVSHKNVTAIPASYTESQNYVAASELVITKPGWSTVSEAVVLHKPLVLVQRGAMREDSNTIRALQNNHPFHLIDWEQLMDGNIMNGARSSCGLSTFRRETGEGAGQIAAYLDQIVRSGS